MIAPQWVIGCGYITLKMLFYLLRLLERWLDSTILIKYKDACKDTVSIQGILMTYMLSKSLEKNQKALVIFTRGNCHLCRNKREEF